MNLRRFLYTKVRGSRPTAEKWPKFDLNRPAQGEPLLQGGIIAGWALSPAGMREITIWLDGQEIGRAVADQERKDVEAKFPGMLGALRSGFRYKLDASALKPPLPRTMELRLVLEDLAGNRAEIRRVVEVQPEPIQPEPIQPEPIQPEPINGSLDIPKHHPPEDPLREAGWSDPLVVFGWAIDVNGIDRIEVLLDGQVVGEATHGMPREDVELLRPEYRQIGLASRSGWLAIIPTEGRNPGRHDLSAVVHGKSGTLQLNTTPVWLRAESARAIPTRRQRMEAVLRCPKCSQPFGRSGRELTCCGCGIPVQSNAFGTLLLEETYAGLDWRQAGFTSHGYPLGAAAVIMDCRDGLVLDIGAGLRENLPNVIQLDAIPFPTTDVSANAESLPFADESFDGVVACNLLEHVSDPQEVIRQIRRVCKLGGRVYTDFTSVHPYHGFPHHYFNATETGLDWLMREVGGASGTVESCDARVTLRLVLEQWLASLEDAGTRDQVGSLTVGSFVDLLREPQRAPDLYKAIGHLSVNGRRLIPPKVTFTGLRTR